jgi:hypothetical protein
MVLSELHVTRRVLTPYSALSAPGPNTIRWFSLLFLKQFDNQAYYGSTQAVAPAKSSKGNEQRASILLSALQVGWRLLTLVFSPERTRAFCYFRVCVLFSMAVPLPGILQTKPRGHAREKHPRQQIEGDGGDFSVAGWLEAANTRI